MAQATERRTNQESIEKIKEALIPHIHETRCHPILIRLAWHDSGSYDKVRKVALPSSEVCSNMGSPGKSCHLGMHFSGVSIARLR